ncbi:hypothetical protein [Paraburkholderia diazotrophica]|uniref:hypothetical protein n=1 Tax=Paraburkholderia diazotrophica TaxID=667676 RepID=UPI00115F87D8|nr:hypothetical protein [Paraburkholderia diazotrophica]
MKDVDRPLLAGITRLSPRQKAAVKDAKVNSVRANKISAYSVHARSRTFTELMLSAMNSQLRPG